MVEIPLIFLVCLPLLTVSTQHRNVPMVTLDYESYKKEWASKIIKNNFMVNGLFSIEEKEKRRFLLKIFLMYLHNFQNNK